MRAPIPMTAAAAAEPFPLDCAEELPMRVFRHIGAAYETGDADCWDAAHARAEEVLGPDAGALLVARATAILRLIRIDRPDFNFLPTPADRCRAMNPPWWPCCGLPGPRRLPRSERRGHILDDLHAIGLLASAACALVGRDLAPMSIGVLHAARSRQHLHAVK